MGDKNDRIVGEMDLLDLRRGGFDQSGIWRVPSETAQMKHTLARNLPAAFFAMAIFAPILWMVLDRDQPYFRISGELIPSNPAPGDFVTVKWRIKVNKWCRPSAPNNVTRQITTSDGQLLDYQPVQGVYGTDDRAATNEREDLSRTFQIPPSATRGPATYYSRACFSCNPLQDIWPVCVDTPKIQFTIK